MRFTRESDQHCENNPEVKHNFTQQEFTLWYEPFLEGQRIFNSHVSNGHPDIPLHICPTYGGKESIICYVEEKDVFIATFLKLEKMINGIKRQKSGISWRSTNAHLIRLGVCTTPSTMAAVNGIEESAHAHFHNIIKTGLDENDISYTGRYDGSDSSEEYAFQQISQIILRNNKLPLFPLPQNFDECCQILE